MLNNDENIVQFNVYFWGSPVAVYERIYVHYQVVININANELS